MHPRSHKSIPGDPRPRLSGGALRARDDRSPASSIPLSCGAIGGLTEVFGFSHLNMEGFDDGIGCASAASASALKLASVAPHAGQFVESLGINTKHFGQDVCAIRAPRSCSCTHLSGGDAKTWTNVCSITRPSPERIDSLYQRDHFGLELFVLIGTPLSCFVLKSGCECNQA